MINAKTKRLIIEMHEEGNAMDDIYKTMKVSAGTVYRILKAAGVKQRGSGNGIRRKKVKKHTESIKDKGDIEMAVAMYRQGKAIVSIQKETGVNQPTLYLNLKMSDQQEREKNGGIIKRKGNVAWYQEIQYKLKPEKKNTYTDAKVTFIDNICRGSGWAI